MKASIIIPTFNKLSRLKLTLASFNNQTHPVCAFEVIVVDDGSTDGTGMFLEGYRADFNLSFILQKNQGRGAARNAGVSAAQGELIIFVDDDLILHPGYIEAHIAMQQNHPGVVHGKIVNLSYLKFFADPTAGIYYSDFARNAQTGDALKSKLLSEADITERFAETVAPNRKMTKFETLIRGVLSRKISGLQWIGCTGGNVSLPKTYLESVNRFEESYGTKWGCEDLELGYRLFEHGYPFFYSDAAVNYHLAHYRENFEAQLEDTFADFYKKHPDDSILEIKDFLLSKTSPKDFLEHHCASALA